MWKSENRLKIVNQKYRSVPTLAQMAAVASEDIRDYVLQYIVKNEPEKIFKKFPQLDMKDILQNLGFEFSEPEVFHHITNDITHFDISIVNDLANLPLQHYQTFNFGIFGHLDMLSQEEENEFLLPWSEITEEVVDEAIEGYKESAESVEDIEHLVAFFQQNSHRKVGACAEMQERNEEFDEILQRIRFDRIDPDIVHLDTMYWPIAVQKISKHLLKFHEAFKNCFNSGRSYYYEGLSINENKIRIDWGS